jgi:hypothetical protein
MGVCAEAETDVLWIKQDKIEDAYQVPCCPLHGVASVKVLAQRATNHLKD